MEFRPENLIRGVFKTASFAVAAIVVGLLGLVTLFIIQITRDLPDVKTLKEFHHSHATEIYSDDGKKIGEFTTERRYPVQFDQIPKHVIQAFLASEDSNFYQHKGIDVGGIFRAIFSNLLKGRFAQGASTITQQVARGLLLSTRKKEITRKVREMILARRMEKELTKNEILALYLSDIYLGHGAYGIGAGARNYFQKSVSELTVAEGALLAGLPQRPNDWDPFHNPHIAKRRQHYVLNRMVEERFITPDESKQAFQTPLKLFVLEDLNNSVAPYYTEYVRQYLMNRYGSERILSDGFKVYTSLKFDLQKVAEQSVDRGLRAVDKRLGWRGVATKLQGTEAVEKFLTEYHEDILEKVTPSRILPVVIDEKNRRLEFDLSDLQKPGGPHFGPTPVKEGGYYKAVITAANDAQKMALAKIGRSDIEIPWATMEWVKGKETTMNLVSQVVKPGDVVLVKIDKIDRFNFRIEASLEQEPEIQGALLSYDVETGHVRALVGGTDFAKSKFNIALQAKRQVGSTFKPLLYSAAMDKGFSPSSIVTDSPIVFKFEGQLDADNAGEPWRPRNYAGKFEGDIPLRLALIRSMNIPSVKLLNELTIDYVIEYARTLGITSPLQRDLSIALGSWSSSLEELSRAYAIFPRLGKPIALNYVKRVEDIDGKVLEEHNTGDASIVPRNQVNPDPELNAKGLVISPQTAYVMTDMLRGVVREGTGTGAAVVGGPIAGKTGTSNDHRDAWFIGYSPAIMTGVWLGYEKDKPLDPSETGGKAAAPIFAEFMTAAVAKYPKAEFPVPDDVVFAYVDKETGRLATASTVKRVRVAFKSGTVPDSTGGNLLRVGDPGIRHTTASGNPDSRPQATTPPAAEETDDFLREGYQE